MFFTSEVTIPLETLSDVLEAYPSWRLKILDGLQIYFLGSNVPQVFRKIRIMLAENISHIHSNLYNFSIQGKEKIYAEFFERFTEYPVETSISSVEKGLDFLKQEDQSVVFIEQSQIRGYFKSNPFHNQK